VNSALQRARKTVDERVPETAQQVELGALGADGRRDLVDAFVSAWERADLEALLELLSEDARFTMPPLPAWFRGREDVGRFFAERMFATPWRLLPLRANGQLGFACYILEPGWHRAGSGRRSDRWYLAMECPPSMTRPSDPCDHSTYARENVERGRISHLP
jgi:hypothetical protein